jgi:hypothetical protein
MPLRDVGEREQRNSSVKHSAARHSRREANHYLPGGFVARVLEPSPPADTDPGWYADDPTDPAGSPGLVTPIPGEGVTWGELAECDARVAAQVFDDPALDASSLLIPIVGFLPSDDPRVMSTIEAVMDRLTDARGLVLRYRADDGLDGDEGSFLLCTFWLAHALALAGRADEARRVFERAAGYGNDLGLFSEEVDTATGELIGNFPQAVQSCRTGQCRMGDRRSGSGVVTLP